jgi:hypothetical protein
VSTIDAGIKAKHTANAPLKEPHDGNPSTTEFPSTTDGGACPRRTLSPCTLPAVVVSSSEMLMLHNNILRVLEMSIDSQWRQGRAG